MRSVKEFRQQSDPFFARVAGMVRRMAIGVTAKALWQLIGHRMPDGEETFTAEAFANIGFFARPPTNGTPEAIVVMVGDANAPVIVATRDEKTRAAIAGAIKANESAMYNSVSLVYVKDDGTIEARTKAGSAQKLVTETAYNALDAVLGDISDLADALIVAHGPIGTYPEPGIVTAATALKAQIVVYKAELGHLSSKLKGE